MHFVFGVLVGFVTGAFTPAVGRKLKALFVNKTTAAKSAAEKKSRKFSNEKPTARKRSVVAEFFYYSVRLLSGSSSQSHVDVDTLQFHRRNVYRSQRKYPWR
jgi:hypothetical protein